jgi:superfamily II DNA or RNA helicase
VTSKVAHKDRRVQEQIADRTNAATLDRLRTWIAKSANWKHEFVLGEHQLIMLSFSLHIPGALAKAPCGSGKTATGLAYMNFLKEEGICNRFLVICRTSGISRWEEDNVKCLKGYTTHILKGRTPEGSSIQHSPDVIHVINWAVLKHWYSTIKEYLCREKLCIVFDEVHNAKNSKRFKTSVGNDGKRKYQPVYTRSSCAAFLSRKATRRIAVTATPVYDTPSDLWSIYDIVEPGMWGRSDYEFKQRYTEAEHTGYGWKYSGTKRERELRGRGSWFTVEIEPSMVSGLPGLNITKHIVPNSKPQKMTKAELKKLKIKPRETLAALANKAAKLKLKYVIQHLKELVDDTQGQWYKTCVFVNQREHVDILAKGIKDCGVKVYHAHGGTPIDKRDEILKEYYNTTDSAILIGTGQAWGESGDIQCVNRGIIVTIPWSPTEVEQWVGRWNRKNPAPNVVSGVDVEFMVLENSYDERILDIQSSKLEALEALGHKGASNVLDSLDGDNGEQSLLDAIGGFLD